MVLETMIILLLILFIVIIISALPLYLAVSLLGGRASILNSFLVMIAIGFITVFSQIIFPFFGVIITFLLGVLLFREVFRLKWIKAFLLWIVWFLMIILLSMVFSFFTFGLAFFSFF